MRLKALKIKNFRCYRKETVIDFDSLAVFIGKNDAGKSSILEALEIFFNNSVVKIDNQDLNVDAASANDNKIELTCVFCELPSELVIDASYPTTLHGEYLLNSDGDLEIKKVFSCSSSGVRSQVFVVAFHPTAENGNDLLQLKRQELRDRANQLGVLSGNYNGSINSSMRRAIWDHLGDLELGTVLIQVDKEDARKAWDYLEMWMPQYALFKSDRSNNDGDKEVTDPMKVAITNALAELQEDLQNIRQKVMEKAIEVAQRTLEKLNEMNPDLAGQLTPDFKADPKWAGLFSLTLASDKNIPMNKRGSGVRRLIVLNFFRAEAERRRNEKNSKAIIYAFEEPENSQHPNYQEMLVKAFQELAETDNTQVIVTTHNPALAGLVNEEDLKLVTVDSQGDVIILSKEEEILRTIAKTLGLLPEPLKPRLLICVEGPNDVHFFKTISSVIHQNRADLPDLSTDSRIAVFPLGGGTLKEWVTQNYLKGLGIPEYHIYDLDDQINPPYKGQRDVVRARGGKNWAELTSKRETENYLHPRCIHSVYGFSVSFGDMDDVPELIARTQHELKSPNLWETLDETKKKKKNSSAKKRLNYEVAQAMTWEDIQESDTSGDIIRWLEGIRDRVK